VYAFGDTKYVNMAKTTPGITRRTPLILLMFFGNSMVALFKPVKGQSINTIDKCHDYHHPPKKRSVRLHKVWVATWEGRKFGELEP
jgi:hypothetical protein